ncbi:MAG: hypothetical protein COT84_01245 [Chlamydiae bacterium CG10_big_fil_rev_8_21_14_0_10_35_9]|nr:MAG: hypothetical protein COT84_01245 [Chlamydiae bacterium CG10_big_fil_rev_8_21_14_0_10_35_9]
MKHWFYVNLTGMIWLSGGMNLVIKGTRLITENHFNIPFLVTLFSLAVLIGTFKNVFIFKKVVKRVVDRIASLKMPISIFKIYDRRFYILIALMIMVSVLLNALRVPSVIRGFVDFAIGFGLIQGAFRYFKFALALKKASYF